MNKIYTIGHSNRSSEDFINLLKIHGINMVVDVRRFPGSRKYPHFNKELLKASLDLDHIGYIHMEDLGGRRSARKDSHNTIWKNAAFKGYADYMETEEFDSAIAKLISIAEKVPAAIMCSEAVWWRCHRSLISDRLKKDGWEVLHIIGKGPAKEHPYTGPARELIQKQKQ